MPPLKPLRWVTRGWGQAGRHRLNRLIGRAAAAARRRLPSQRQGAPSILAAGTGLASAGVAAVAAGELATGGRATCLAGGELATKQEWGASAKIGH